MVSQRISLRIKGWQTVLPSKVAKIRRIDRCPNIPCKLSPPLHDTANTWRRRDVNNGDVNSPCTIKLHFHWQNRVDASHVTASTLTIHLIVVHPSILISKPNRYSHSPINPAVDEIWWTSDRYKLSLWEIISRNSTEWRYFRILLENWDTYLRRIEMKIFSQRFRINVSCMR